MLFLWLPFASPATGVAGEAETAPSAAPRITHLQFREVDFAPLCTEISIQSGARFTKEPVFSGSGVFRGLFQLGKDTNQFMPFAWDSGARKLHLDLNRNHDLTDDPNGHLTAPASDLQLFRGIRLEFPSPTDAYRVVVDAHVFAGPASTPRVFLYVRSLWEGSFELNGRKWYLAVIDHPDGRLGPATSLREVGDRMVLRPWEDRDQPALWWHASLSKVHALSHVKLVTFPYRWAGNAEVFDGFNAPGNLFFGNQAFHLDYRVERGEGPANLAITFSPTYPSLGKLQLGGESIRRIVLDNSVSPGGFSAVMDAPGPEVEVPVGVYPRQLVLLQHRGFTNVAVGITTNRLTVSEGQPAKWTAGAPLNNTVEVSLRYGRTYLDYRLTNRAGGQFHLAFQEEKSPPRFEVRQGENLISQGKFEFG